MKKHYEYLFVSPEYTWRGPKETTEDLVNRYGKDGWRLVQIIYSTNIIIRELWTPTKFVFEREIEELQA